MAWIESHQTLREHPKTKLLARRLGVARVAVIGHLHCLWWWALDYAQDGVTGRYDDDMVAEAADWPGDAREFVAALRAVGFLDTEPDRIHDWHDFAGKLVDRRRTNAERMREARAAQAAASVQDTCDERAAHVVDTCGATVPNRTVPNQTNVPANAGTRRAAGAPQALVVVPDGKPKSAHRVMVDALVAAFHEPNTDPEWRKFQAAAAALLKAKPPAAPDEVRGLVAAFGDVFPGATCTPPALVTHLGRLRSGERAPPSRQKREGTLDQIRRLAGMEETG